MKCSTPPQVWRCIAAAATATRTLRPKISGVCALPHRCDGDTESADGDWLKSVVQLTSVFRRCGGASPPSPPPDAPRDPKDLSGAVSHIRQQFQVCLMSAFHKQSWPATAASFHTQVLHQLLMAALQGGSIDQVQHNQVRCSCHGPVLKPRYVRLGSLFEDAAFAL